MTVKAVADVASNTPRLVADKAATTSAPVATPKMPPKLPRNP
jgi:hypothetical protein